MASPVYGAAVEAMRMLDDDIAAGHSLLAVRPRKVTPAGSSPTCDTAGVLESDRQCDCFAASREALKILSGNIGRVNRRMLCFDVWENSYRQIEIASVREEGHCPCCQLRRRVSGRSWELGRCDFAADATRCRSASRDGSSVNLKELAQRLNAAAKCRSTSSTTVDRRPI